LFNKAFLELINDKDPMTNNELRILIKRRPEVYGKFYKFIGKLQDRRK